MHAYARFRLAALGLTALAVLLLSTAAAAAGRQQHESFAFSWADEVFFDCGDFLVLGTGTVEGHVITFFDGAGNPVRVQVHANQVATVENSVTGATLDDIAHLNITEDLVAGEVRRVGLDFQTTVPGRGTIVKQLGLLVIEPDGDLVVHGPHEVLEQTGVPWGTPDFWCPYLA
jgi:hypothetical protein